MNETGKTMIFDNAVIRIYRPNLSDEERTRRMQKIYNAASDLLKDYLKG